MRFIRIREVLQMVGLSRTATYKLIQEGRFPAPIRLTERSAAFVQSMVEAWMRARAQGLEWRPETQIAPFEPGFYRPRRHRG